MIIAGVSFTVRFSDKEVAKLRAAAEAHYDWACRIFGKDQIHPVSVFDWHDFDILSKICESPLIDPAISDSVWRAFEKLRDASDKLTS